MPKTVAQINEEAQALLSSIDQRNLLEEGDKIAALQSHYDKHGTHYETELEDEVFALLNECEGKCEKTTARPANHRTGHYTKSPARRRLRNGSRALLRQPRRRWRA